MKEIDCRGTKPHFHFLYELRPLDALLELHARADLDLDVEFKLSFLTPQIVLNPVRVELVKNGTEHLKVLLLFSKQINCFTKVKSESEKMLNEGKL